MGQSLLIDMNSGWYKHKTELNEGLRTRDYLAAEGALDSLNALLPDEYRVIIDTDEFKRRTRGNVIAFCNHCKSKYEDPKDKKTMVESPTRIDIDRVEKQQLLLPAFDQMLYGKEYDTFWVCPNCNKDNKLSETKFKKSAMQKPYYLKVVPEPPIHRPGLDDRTNFHYKFEKWARAFLTELNAQARQFRHDYKPKEDDGELDGDTEGLYDDESD